MSRITFGKKGSKEDWLNKINELTPSGETGIGILNKCAPIQIDSTRQKLKSESDPADQVPCLLAHSLTLFLFFCSKFCTKFSKQSKLRCV